MNTEERTSILERAAGDAFHSVYEAFNSKGYEFYPYMASGNQEAMALMMGIKSAAKYLALELTEEQVEEKLEQTDNLMDVYRECEGIFLQTGDGKYDPEFVVLKESNPEEQDFTFGGIFPEKSPPVAIEATRIFVAEVSDPAVLPEVEQAVALWNQNLKALSDQGLIEPVEARIVQVK